MTLNPECGNHALYGAAPLPLTGLEVGQFAVSGRSPKIAPGSTIEFCSSVPKDTAQRHVTTDALETIFRENSAAIFEFIESDTACLIIRWPKAFRVFSRLNAVGRTHATSFMKLLAISGSTRKASSNTALLHAIAAQAWPPVNVEVFSGLGDLPIFSPEREGDATPDTVLRFCRAIHTADGLIIASPEYVRSIPGGLKNAIDWLVSRDEIIHKPIVLAHASHRGDDMLEHLRTVLATVSSRFTPTPFLRLPLAPIAERERSAVLGSAESHTLIDQYLADITRITRGFP